MLIKRNIELIQDIKYKLQSLKIVFTTYCNTKKNNLVEVVNI